MIDYVKSSNTKERILAAQLIARFFKYFPVHEEAAFDSIVDLCESVDVDVRKHATMAMIAICRDCKHLVSKAADILIQLYQTNQASEVNLINQSLTTLLNLDIQKFLQSFFTNFEDGTEVVRERALKFLSTKIQTVAESALTKEVEEQLLTYSKKAMEDVTKDEFITFINILTKLKIAKTATGQAMIVLVIKSQAELDKEFDVNDTDSLDKFLLCTRHTIPLLSQYNRASEYISHICTKILPHLSSLASSGNDLNVLQALAEMSPHIHTDDIPELINLEACQQAVYDKLLEFLPLPPTTTPTTADTAATAATNEQDNVPKTSETSAEATKQQEGDHEDPGLEAAESCPPQSDEPSSEPQKDEFKVQEMKPKEEDFQFTHIEYLIYAFHQFGRFNPEFYNEARQSDIRLRLHHLAMGCTKYMEILSAQLKGVKSGEDLKKEENKLRSVALRTTKNISNLIVRDLFKKPPQFKTDVVLSCKPLAARSSEASSTTNPSSISTNSSSRNNNNRVQQFSKGNRHHHHNNNNGNYNKPHGGGGFNRQGGQKHKYQQSYQNDRNKRPRYAR